MRSVNPEPGAAEVGRAGVFGTSALPASLTSGGETATTEVGGAVAARSGMEGAFVAAPFVSLEAAAVAPGRADGDAPWGGGGAA